MINISEYLINKHTKSKFDYPCYILLDAIKKYQKRMSKTFNASRTISIYFDDYTKGWSFSQKIKDNINYYRLINIFYDPALKNYLICGCPCEDEEYEDESSEDISLDFDETIQMDKQTVDELVKIINQKND